MTQFKELHLIWLVFIFFLIYRISFSSLCSVKAFDIYTNVPQGCVLGLLGK